jgi:phenylalanyl-tRNA synthetase beta chain
VDVIEEIARFRLEDVPFTLPARRVMFGRLTREQQLLRRVEDTLAGLGFAETYTPSLRRDDEDPKALRLPEPISADFAVLRTSLLPSLVEAVQRNLDAGAERIALFEIARVYLPAGALPDERVHVAAIVEGGFARGKGAVEALCRALKVEPTFERGQHPLLHPGKTATLPWGVLGELHPQTLEGTWSAFELELAPLFEASLEPVTYEDVITFPPVRQDLAFSVPEEVSAGDVVAVAREAAGPELREMRAFDVYRGEQVGPGRKSIAFAVTFQSSERTLSDEDAARLRTSVVDVLATRFGAELRS